MKKFYLLLFILIPFHGFSQNYVSKYMAFPEPQPYNGTINYLNDELHMTQQFIGDLKHAPSLLNSFPNIISNVSIFEIQKNGLLRVQGVGISSKNKEYTVIYDFTQTQSVPYLTKDSAIVQALLGVGVRMIATIKTKKSGIDLANPLTLSANMENIKGSLEVRVMGIISSKINSLIPTTTDLSTASILSALQSISTVKSHMYGSETIIIPQIIGREVRETNAYNVQFYETKQPLFRNSRYKRGRGRVVKQRRRYNVF